MDEKFLLDQAKKEIIGRLISGQKGVTENQARVIGVEWPLRSGWRKKFLRSIGHKSWSEIERDCHNKDMAVVAKETGKKFYSSLKWKKARFEILKKYGAKCMLCGSTSRIVVDHIKPRRFFPHLELCLDNLQVLCNDCNRGKSYDDTTDFRSV